MARYTGAVCRLCRREGQKLFLKGERCYSAKCAIARREYAPGSMVREERKPPNTACSFVRSRRQDVTTEFWKDSLQNISIWLSVRPE